MSFLVSFGVFLLIGAIPYYSPTIITWLQLGLFAEMAAGYAVPFMLNWFINIGSNMMYVSSCKGSASSVAVIWTSMTPSIINGIFSAVLNFIPILKGPLLLFAIGGASWIVDTIVILISNYLIAAPITLGVRSAWCKKKKK
jgi:hypothetical protein